MTDRIWVNHERTILATMWDDGTLEVATRPDRYATWGPPTMLTEEPQPEARYRLTAGVDIGDLRAAANGTRYIYEPDQTPRKPSYRAKCG